MITYRTEIIRALEELGGTASLKEIYCNIEEKDELPYIRTNPSWKDGISAEIQRHCKDTGSYRGAEDIFYSVFGLRQGIWGLNSYRGLLSNSDENPLEKRQLQQIGDDRTLNETEKLALIASRRGQGIFREKVINRFGACIITGVDDRMLLIASHIKPWRFADNFERLSSENGLLLTPTYDKLFDIGYITFDKNCKMVISKKLNDINVDKLKIFQNIKYINNASSEMLLNLEYHRDVIFKVN